MTMLLFNVIYAFVQCDICFFENCHHSLFFMQMDPLRPEVHLALTLKEEFGQQLFTYSMEEGNVRFCKLTENMRAALIKEEDLPVNLAIVNNAVSPTRSWPDLAVLDSVDLIMICERAGEPRQVF